MLNPFDVPQNVSDWCREYGESQPYEEMRCRDVPDFVWSYCGDSVEWPQRLALVAGMLFAAALQQQITQRGLAGGMIDFKSLAAAVNVGKHCLFSGLRAHIGATVRAECCEFCQAYLEHDGLIFWGMEVQSGITDAWAAPDGQLIALELEPEDLEDRSN